MFRKNKIYRRFNWRFDYIEVSIALSTSGLKILFGQNYGINLKRAKCYVLSNSAAKTSIKLINCGKIRAITGKPSQIIQFSWSLSKLDKEARSISARI